ncbi:hypothetical protein D1872_327690 [compost metagenome]
MIGIFHDRTSHSIPAWNALVSITFEAPGRSVIEEILAELRGRGYDFWLSD